MPTRTDTSKKDEMTTYKRLKLYREQKSFKKRSKAEASKLYRYIGENTTERPYLKVLRDDYLKLWREIKEDYCGKRSPSNIERKIIERKIYDEMAHRHYLLSDLEASFHKKHGRGMTPKERSLYSHLLQKGEKASPLKKAKMNRRTLLNNLLEKIGDVQKKCPAKIQQIWASIVGEETAQETLLEKVDAQKGFAVCRCLSSTRAFQLRRQKNLPKKLSAELGLNIQRIIFRS